MAVGAADQEGDVRHGIVTPARQAAGEGLAVQNLAAAVERDQHGSVRNRPQQQLALARISCGRRQLLLLLELAQRERPADAAGIVLVEIAFGAAAGAADAGDREFHAGFLARRARTAFAGLGAASVSSAHIFSSA